MHDIRAIRDDPDAFDRAWASRGLPAQTPDLLALDEKLRVAQTALQAAQSRRNEASKLIGQAKAKKDEAGAAALMAEVEGLKVAIAAQTAAEVDIGAELRARLAALPNRPAADVPVAEDEHGNVEVRRYGEPYKIDNPRDHVDLGVGSGAHHHVDHRPRRRSVDRAIVDSGRRSDHHVSAGHPGAGVAVHRRRHRGRVPPRWPRVHRSRSGPTVPPSRRPGH